MSDAKLFRIEGGRATELPGSAVVLEKSLQTLIEKNLEELLGVRFLASEYSTGKTHAGRIDTLGLDENGCPVILEYKRALGENVINQGLFYLNWLLDHRGEFQLAVMQKFGKKTAEQIDWSAPRLLCVAADFTKYDEHAVQQIDRNIELIRYRRFGGDLLLLELVNATSAAPAPVEVGRRARDAATSTYKTVAQQIDKAEPDLRDLYEELRAFLLAIGGDVHEKALKYYVAFRRLKNFACVTVYATKGKCVTVWVKVKIEDFKPETGFVRDVSEIGHFGTGSVEISLKTRADLERAKPLLVKSYEGS